MNPSLRGQFNLNVERRIQYHDNCLPEWNGRLTVDRTATLSGPAELIFDGSDQGVFPGDTRPIRVFPGFRCTQPGFHFIRLVDRNSGVEAWSNPVYVSAAAPGARIYWGDPHWQTFFTDGIRCPEELYAFARDEGFLDFGAITDHMEGITDHQWDYFQSVTNAFDQPDRFVTLIGQEWTNSERHADAGNPMAIQHCQGEVHGQHVVDALRRGYRMGFVGGGDIHDGRPGDSFHNESYPPSPDRTWPEGFTAVRVLRLTRDAVLDAIAARRTYATTASRIYLDASLRDRKVTLRAASEEGLATASIVIDGEDALTLHPDDDPRIIAREELPVAAAPGSFVYIRLTTTAGNMAWSSPWWID